MKGKIVLGVIFVCLFATSVFGDPNTEIRYSVTDLGSDQWEYIYTVENIGLAGGIEEFTIWFDYGLYDNLVVTTPETPAVDWDEIIWQPEPVLEDDGAYDALAEMWNPGIGVDKTVGGFSVSFDWLGVGKPGPQFYQIIHPVTFVTLDYGYTIPEPATLILFGLGGLCLRRKRKV